MDSYESIAAEPAFQSAIHAANGNETEIAKLHTKHLSDVGGCSLADCVVALKGGHPLPAHPDCGVSSTITEAKLDMPGSEDGYAAVPPIGS